MATTETNCCRHCRYWNGGGSRPAPCFKIRGQNGEWFTIQAGGAAFYAEAPDVNGPYLMTGPEFGCRLFEAGRARYWGDRGD